PATSAAVGAISREPATPVRPCLECGDTETCFPPTPAFLPVTVLVPPCPLCGGPKSPDDRDRSLCHTCRTRPGPGGSLGEPLLDLLTWFGDEPRTVEGIRAIFRRYEGLYEICRLAYQNLDYRRHEDFPEVEFSRDIWDRLFEWLV